MAKEKMSKRDKLSMAFKKKNNNQAKAGEDANFDNRANVVAAKEKKETKKKSAPKKTIKAEDVAIKENTLAEEVRSAEPVNDKKVPTVEAPNEVKVKEVPVSEKTPKTETIAEEQAVEVQPMVISPNVPSKKAPALPMKCTKLDGELRGIGFEVPNAIKDVIEEIAKETTRKYTYVFNLLFEYALEINPISEYKQVLKFGNVDKKEKALHNVRISASILEQVDEICKELDRPKAFVLNMLLEYALEQIGRI